MGCQSRWRASWTFFSICPFSQPEAEHCQTKFYTACFGTGTRSSFTVFAHESAPRSARFVAENGLYLFALTVPKLFLDEEGYAVSTAVDGPTALEAVARGTMRPDLVLADYNLPNGLNGVQVSEKLSQELNRGIPFIILTGDISMETLRDIALHDCVHLNKPVKLGELTRTIEKLLAKPPDLHVVSPHHTAEALSVSAGAKIIVVDDDDLVREAMRAVLEDDGRVVETYSSCETFLEAFDPSKSACLLIDAYLPGMSGLELLERLRNDGHSLPAIMITGNADVPMAVQAMKAGALDFIEKPIGREELIGGIERALELSRNSGKLLELRESASAHLAESTTRQREVMERVLAGQPSKNIAADLGISQRTVENHRAGIMKRTGSKSLPALASWGSWRRAEKNSRRSRLKSRGARAVNWRGYGQGPRADECDHRRFWSRPPRRSPTKSRASSSC